MRGIDLFYDSYDLLHYKFHTISLNLGRSYIVSHNWLKNKKATINLKNYADKCFQYAVTIALNYQNIKNNPRRISKIKPFMGQYNWQEINFPSHKKDWKTFESNNKSIGLNISQIPYNIEKIRHAYQSKHNLNSENQVTLLMITDGEKWHYLAVKRLSCLFRRKTSIYVKILTIVI